MAKNYFLIVLLAFCAIAMAQNEEQPKFSKEYFRIYYIFTNGVGDNVIAKANKPVGGIGMGVTFATLKKIHIIGGYEFIRYNISDKSLAGNADKTNLLHLYLKGMYKIPVGKKFEVNPDISLGYMYINQRKNKRSFGSQDAFCITPGFTFDFKAIENLRFFAGINYCLAFTKTDTNPEYKKFFGQLHMLNIVTGVKL